MKKIFKPWGYYKIIKTGHNWQVKEIYVNPNSSLSLQKHKYRSEYWIIVEGIANVQLNNQKKFLKENQSIFIPPETIHRLSNTTDRPLKIIEVQNGSYLGEDDIIRYEDKYGRTS